MMMFIIISLKRITLCKSTIDDDYTQGSSSIIAIRISNFSTKESRLANEKGDHKTPKSNLIKSILFSTIATTAMSKDAALSLSLSLSLYRQSALRFVLFCFLIEGGFCEMGCTTHAEIFFLLSTCSHTIGWQQFFGALVDCEEFCEKVSLRTFSMTSLKIPSTVFFFFSIFVVVALSPKL
jgi:hypothetical protein